MLSYFFFSTTSILCIFQLKNILEIYNKSFSYLKTLLILIFFIFILINLGLFKYLYIFKILIFLSLIWFLYKKQIKLSIVDQVFFLGSFFLIYYNYQTFFSGTDIFNNFGYFSKYLFYFQNLPSIDSDQKIFNGQYSLPQIIFHNFFLGGKKIFSEELSNYSNNIFLLINFIIIFEIFKHKKNYFHIFCTFAIFYFLINIFGAEGLTIRNEEISILLYFSLIVFVINIDKVSYSDCFIIILSLTMALLNKPSTLFFIFLPFSITFIKFYNEKYSLTKILLSFFIALLLFSHLYKIHLHPLQYGKLNVSILETHEKNFKIPEVKKNIILISTDRFVEIVKSIINKTNIDNSKIILIDMFDTETYKASFSISRIFSKNISIEYFSLNLKKWFFLFSIFLIILFFKRRSLKLNFLYIFFLYSLFVINFSASFVNETIKHTVHNKNYEIAKSKNEITDSPKYDIVYTQPVTDYSRYNGWSIFLIFLCLTYYLYNYEKDKLKYLLIFLILISPLRAFGNLIKVYKNSEQYRVEYNKEMNVLNEIKDKNVKNCLNKGTIFILDKDVRKNINFNRKVKTIRYYMMKTKLNIYSANDFFPEHFTYDQFLSYDFNYLSKKNNIMCIITHSETEVDKVILSRYKNIFNKGKYNFYQIK